MSSVSEEAQSRNLSVQSNEECRRKRIIIVSVSKIHSHNFE